MTHIGHSEKVLVMRVFIAVLVLIFSFQSWTKADDIRDFEIEGMSIGDSLLKYVSLDDTIKAFKGLLAGDYDDLPEQAFYMVGTIEEAVEKAKTL